MKNLLKLMKSYGNILRRVSKDLERIKLERRVERMRMVK